MLKHIDTPQTSTLSAAKVRVTPEELAAAVTALQIRKEGQPGTIAIGDAVEELGLNVTPEEVLAEVQAGRIKQRYLVTRPPKRRLRVLLAAFLVLVGVSFWGVSQRPHHHSIPFTSGPAVPSVAPLRAKTLDGVGDSQLVYVDARGLAQIMEKASGSQIKVSPTEDNYMWGIIKHHGNIYLVGYVSTPSESQMKRSHTALYSGPPNGYLMSVGEDQVNYTAVTVPVETMHLEDTQMGEYAEKVVVSGIHPDSYLWEN